MLFSYKFVFSALMKTCHSTSLYQVWLYEDQLREVIGINSNYRFLLPEAVRCCFVISFLMKTCHSSYISVPSLVVRELSIGRLHA